MKTGNISDATKVLILVATVIVVCVLCAIGFKMTNEGKSAINSSTSNLNNMTSQYQDIDKAIYDGATVQGSEVVNLIKKVLGSEEYLAIRVSTKANANRDYNYSFNAGGEATAAALGNKTTNHISTSKSEG